MALWHFIKVPSCQSAAKVSMALSMSDYRFHLDRSKPRRKYSCPACGKRGRFTRYVDEQGEIAFPDNVGICDRINSCGYHYTPSQYFADNTWLAEQHKVPTSSFHRLVGRPKLTPVTSVTPITSYIPSEVMKQSLQGYDLNPFYRYLVYCFGEREANRLCYLYHVGTSKRWRGSCIFWQVDFEQRVRSGKIMLYDERTGHRVKGERPGVTWVHSLLRLKDFNLSQCFFGEHLLLGAPDKRVMIVESEKTAIIAAHFMPDYLWLATGGISNLRPSASLRNRDVILFPDLGAETKWKDKLSALRRVCRNVIISNYLNQVATDEQRRQGLDLADYLLLEPTPHMLWHNMQQRNPALRQLQEQLGLQLIEDG